jgi:hypothetical protein
MIFYIFSVLFQLYNQLCCGCALLEAAITGNPYECGYHMNTLCSIIVPLLASPLAAPRVSQVFLKLGHIAFDDDPGLGD